MGSLGLVPDRCGLVPDRPRTSSGPKPRGWGPLLWGSEILVLVNGKSDAKM